MGAMEEEQYDWVDDESLDLDESLRRFHRLEYAPVVTSAESYRFATHPRTWAGKAETLTRQYFGTPQGQVASFS
jgi:hypothetical protein